MRIQQRASNFSQFSDELWLTAIGDQTRVDFEIEQHNLLEYANHLLAISYDCLRKSKKDTDELENQICDLMEEISEKDK